MRGCRHWRGVLEGDLCRAGVRWSDVSPNPLSVGPCFSCSGTCGSASYPTRAEVLAEEADAEESEARILRARAAILAHVGRARGVAGAVPCPVCGGDELRYSVKHNGHVHAACATRGCVRWVE